MGKRNNKNTSSAKLDSIIKDCVATSDACRKAELRIATSITSLFEQYLGLRVSNAENPLPVTRDCVLLHLQLVALASEGPQAIGGDAEHRRLPHRRVLPSLPPSPLPPTPHRYDTVHKNNVFLNLFKQKDRTQHGEHVLSRIQRFALCL